MKFLKTTELFGLVKPLLTALAKDGKPLFEAVEYYDSQRLADGLRAMNIFKQRVCLLVPAGDTYASRREGAMLISERTTQFHLLIGDRDYSAKPDAFFGGAKNVGVLDMKDIVTEALTGAKLAAGVILAPVGGGALNVPDKQGRDSPGRECWVQTFECWAGAMRVPTGR